MDRSEEIGLREIGGPTAFKQPIAAPRSAPVADLIGGFEDETTFNPAAAAPVAAPRAHTVDLMDEGSSFPSSSAAQSAAATNPPAPASSAAVSVQPSASSDDFGEDFFSGGARAPVPAAAAAAPSEPPRAAAAPPAAISVSRPAPRPAPDLIGDLHGFRDVDVGSNQHLYQQAGDEGEGEEGGGGVGL